MPTDRSYLNEGEFPSRLSIPFTDEASQYGSKIITPFQSQNNQISGIDLIKIVYRELKVFSDWDKETDWRVISSTGFSFMPNVYVIDRSSYLELVVDQDNIKNKSTTQSSTPDYDRNNQGAKVIGVDFVSRNRRPESKEESPFKPSKLSGNSNREGNFRSNFRFSYSSNKVVGIFNMCRPYSFTEERTIVPEPGPVILMAYREISEPKRKSILSRKPKGFPNVITHLSDLDEFVELPYYDMVFAAIDPNGYYSRFDHFVNLGVRPENGVISGRFGRANDLTDNQILSQINKYHVFRREVGNQILKYLKK